MITNITVPYSYSYSPTIIYLKFGQQDAGICLYSKLRCARLRLAMVSASLQHPGEMSTTTKLLNGLQVGGSIAASLCEPWSKRLCGVSYTEEIRLYFRWSSCFLNIFEMDLQFLLGAAGRKVSHRPSLPQFHNTELVIGEQLLDTIMHWSLRSITPSQPLLCNCATQQMHQVLIRELPWKTA